MYHSIPRVPILFPNPHGHTLGIWLEVSPHSEEFYSKLHTPDLGFIKAGLQTITSLTARCPAAATLLLQFFRQWTIYAHAQICFTKALLNLSEWWWVCIFFSELFQSFQTPPGPWEFDHWGTFSQRFQAKGFFNPLTWWIFTTLASSFFVFVWPCKQPT